MVRTYRDDNEIELTQQIYIAKCEGRPRRTYHEQIEAIDKRVLNYCCSLMKPNLCTTIDRSTYTQVHKFFCIYQIAVLIVRVDGSYRCFSKIGIMTVKRYINRDIY